MTDVSLIQFARLLGSKTLIGMAQKMGLTPPPPPISIRHLIDLAVLKILSFAPFDLQPQNGASGVANNPNLFFRDPGAGTPAAGLRFEFIVTQNNVIVDPDHVLTGGGSISSPVTPPGFKWFFPLPPGEVTLSVTGINKAGKGPASTSTFTVSSPPPPPRPQISVSSSGSGQSSVFVVTGSRFLPSHVVNIRVVDDALNTLNLQQSADGQGNLNARFGIPCTSRLGLHFSATDGRPDPTNVLNQLESNTFDIPCPQKSDLRFPGTFNIRGWTRTFKHVCTSWLQLGCVESIGRAAVVQTSIKALRLVTGGCRDRMLMPLLRSNALAIRNFLSCVSNVAALNIRV